MQHKNLVTPRKRVVTCSDAGPPYKISSLVLSHFLHSTKTRSHRDSVERHKSAKDIKFDGMPTSTNMPATDKSQIKNADSAAKDAGFETFPAFLLSYGLTIHNHGDVQEGKAILKGMGYGVKVSDV